jgi:hypothetical protein
MDGCASPVLEKATDASTMAALAKTLLEPISASLGSQQPATIPAKGNAARYRRFMTPSRGLRRAPKAHPHHCLELKTESGAGEPWDVLDLAGFRNGWSELYQGAESLEERWTQELKGERGRRNDARTVGTVRATPAIGRAVAALIIVIGAGLGISVRDHQRDSIGRRLTEPERKHEDREKPNDRPHPSCSASRSRSNHGRKGIYHG